MRRSESYSNDNLRTPTELYPVVHDLSDMEYSGSICCGFNGDNDIFLQPATTPSAICDICPCEIPSPMVDCPCPIGDKEETKSQRPPTVDDECLEPSIEIPLQVSPSLDVTVTLEVDEDQEHRNKRDTSYSPRRYSCGSRDPSTSGMDDSSMFASEHSTSSFRPKKFHIRRKSRALLTKFLPPRTNSNITDNSFENDTEPLQRQRVEVGTSQESTEEPSNHSNLSANNFLDTYVLTRQVFKCRYCVVWECVHKVSGVRYCVKIFDRNTPALQSRTEESAVLSEMEILYKICVEQGGHASICQRIDVIAEGPKLYVVLELATGGNLLSRVVQEERLEEDQVKDVVRSMLEGLVFLHSQNVVHADLCPENILLANSTCGSNKNGADLSYLSMPSLSAREKSSSNAVVKIADFGSAVDLDVHEPFGSRYGSTKYTAPECLRADEPFNTSADMWSVGVLTYFMLSGTSPWDDASKRKTMTKALRAEYSFPPHLFSHVSRQAKQFIAGLIHMDPAVRMTAEEALIHPWLHVDAPPKRTHRRVMSLGSESLRSSGRMDNSCARSDRSMHNPPPTGPLTPPTKHDKHHQRKHTPLGSITKGIKSLFSLSPSRQPDPYKVSVPASDRTINTHPTCSSETPLADYPAMESESFESDPHSTPAGTFKSRFSPLGGKKNSRNKHHRFNTWGGI